MSESLDPFEEFRRKKEQEQSLQVDKKNVRPTLTPASGVDDADSGADAEEGEGARLTRDRFDAAEAAQLDRPEGFEDHRSVADDDPPPPSKPDSFQKF